MSTSSVNQYGAVELAVRGPQSEAPSDETPLVGRRNLCQRVSRFVRSNLKVIGCAVATLLLAGGGATALHYGLSNGCAAGERLAQVPVRGIGPGPFEPTHECRCVSRNSTLPNC